MFGCTDPRQVLEEINACKQEYPESYVRVIGFDGDRQVQVVAFIVAKPSATGMAKRRDRGCMATYQDLLRSASAKWWGIAQGSGCGIIFEAAHSVRHCSRHPRQWTA